MKVELKLELKEKGRLEIFTDERYDICKDVMKYATSRDKVLKGYLGISVDFRVAFIADNMIRLVDLKKI